MSEDKKQNGKPTEERPQQDSVPEQTAADQAREALSKATTVVRPGILTTRPVDPFEPPKPDTKPTPGGSDAPDTGGPSANPNEGGGSDTNVSESSEAKK